MQKIVRAHTDFCPFNGCQHTIYVEYFEIRCIGQKAPLYKMGSYRCDCVEDCPYPTQDSHGRCPVYLTAPSEPNLR